jgi:hypothetical protein
VDLALAGVSVLEDLLDWGHALAEQVNAEFLKLGAGDAAGEVFTFGEGLALNFSLMGG